MTKTIMQLAEERGVSYIDDTSKLMMVMSQAMLENICKAYRKQELKSLKQQVKAAKVDLPTGNK